MKKVLNLFLAGIIGTAIVMACTNGTTTNAEINETAAVPDQQAQDSQLTQGNRVNVNDWPETAQKAAKAMMDKYGQPTESTPSMLIWHNTGPITRTVVYKEEVQHDFPMPHKDVLE